MNKVLDDHVKRRIDENEDHRLALYGSLDKLIFAVTSGTLVLSISSIDKVGLPTSCKDLFVLLAAWTSLLVGLIAHVSSFWTAIANTRERRIYFDAVCLDQSKAQVEVLECSSGKKARLVEPDWWVRWTTLCNATATIALLSGIALLAIYVGNLQWKRLQSDTLGAASMHCSDNKPIQHAAVRPGPD
jgi:hypothetical protein